MRLPRIPFASSESFPPRSTPAKLLLAGLLATACLASPAAGDALAGAVVESFDAPCTNPAGIGWHSGALWIVCNEATPTIYAWDPVTESVLDSFPTRAAEGAFGLDHDGTRLWGDTEDPNVIYSADDATGEVLTHFTSPFGEGEAIDPNGVAWDGAALWHSAWQQDLKRVATNGSVLDTIPSPGHHATRDLAWVAGDLWVIDANGYEDDGIFRLRPEDGAVSGFFEPTGATFTLLMGLAYDGTSFWVTDLGAHRIHRMTVNFQIFDDSFEAGHACDWSDSQGAGPC